MFLSMESCYDDAMYRSCFFLLLFSSSIPLTFLDLDRKNQESLAETEVTILGFLVCNEQQEWFLAKQPNIKTCCAGKQKGDIRLLAEFSPELKNQIIRVQGTFQIKKSDTGTVYLLEHPVLISS
jgi:hypothetical protein